LEKLSGDPKHGVSDGTLLGRCSGRNRLEASVQRKLTALLVGKWGWDFFPPPFESVSDIQKRTITLSCQQISLR